VRISSHIVDEKDILADQVKQICRVMKQNYGFQKDQYLKLEYSIDQPVSLLRGNSLGAGMALLAKAGLDTYEKNRTMEYRIYDDVADNDYRLYAKTFPERKMLPYNDPELINYFRSVDYWDGIKWTNKKTINKRYLQTLKKPSRLP